MNDRDVHSALRGIGGDAWHSQDQARQVVDALGLPMEIMALGSLPPVLWVPAQREAWLGGRRVARLRRSGRLADLLATLMESGLSLSREQLYEHVWDQPYRAPYATRSLSSSVHRLRVSLDANAYSLETMPDGRYQLLPARAVLKWVGSAPVTLPGPPRRSVVDLQVLPEAKPLFGRERECQTALASLSEGEIVVLVGPGGIGKTSLAAMVAHRAAEAERFDRVLWVSCAGMDNTSSALSSRILEAAGAGRSPSDALGRMRTLLVLDQSEGVERSLLDLPSWRDASGGLGVLITSRRAPPLSPQTVVRLEGLSDDAADKMIVDIMGSSGSDVDPDLVRSLARAAWGHPLTLKQAAAFAAKVGLRSAVVALPTTMESMAQVALDRSLSLVSQPARDLLRRMGVLDVAAPIELIAALGGVSSAQALLALAELASVHLVERVAAVPSSPFDRWDLHPTTRAWARRDLSGDLADTQKRWRGWVHGLVAPVAEHTSYRRRWSLWPVIKAVLQRCLQVDETTFVGEALCWMGYALLDNLHGGEVDVWFSAALEGPQRAHVRLWLEVFRARGRWHSGRRGEALDTLREVSQLPVLPKAAVEIGPVVASACRMLGVWTAQGDPTKAIEILRSAVELYQRHDPSGAGLALVGLARVTSMAGDKGRAAELLDAAYLAHLACGPAWMNAHIAATTARLMAISGDVSGAMDRIEAHSPPAWYGLRRRANALQCKGIVLLFALRPAKAEAALSESVRLVDPIATSGSRLMFRLFWARCRLEMADPDGAERIVRDGRARYGRHPAAALELIIASLAFEAMADRHPLMQPLPSGVMANFLGMIPNALPTSRASLWAVAARLSLVSGDRGGALLHIATARQNAEASGSTVLAWRYRHLELCLVDRCDDGEVDELAAVGRLSGFPEVRAHTALVRAWRDNDVDALASLDEGPDAITTRDALLRTWVSVGTVPHVDAAL